MFSHGNIRETGLSNQKSDNNSNDFATAASFFSGETAFTKKRKESLHARLLPMNKSEQAFRIVIKLTTFGEVYVRAKSPEEAVRAVQQDLDDGGWTLEEDILQIENEVPHEESQAVFGDVEPDGCADYDVDTNGFLRRIGEDPTVSTSRDCPETVPA